MNCTVGLVRGVFHHSHYRSVIDVSLVPTAISIWIKNIYLNFLPLNISAQKNSRISKNLARNQIYFTGSSTYQFFKKSSALTTQRKLVEFSKKN